MAFGENPQKGVQMSLLAMLSQNTTFSKVVKFMKQMVGAGRFGENDDERRIRLSEFIVEIEKIHKEKGSLGVVFTDNVVSFACGMIGGEWVLYDSHAPASCCATLRGANATLDNIERMIASHFVRSNGIFDATMFTRKR